MVVSLVANVVHLYTLIKYAPSHHTLDMHTIMKLSTSLVPRLPFPQVVWERVLMHSSSKPQTHVYRSFQGSRSGGVVESDTNFKSDLVVTLRGEKICSNLE